MDQLRERATRHHRRTGVVTLIGTGVVAATACLVLATLGHPHGALVLASSAVGTLALVGGVAVLVLGRDASGLPRFRAFAGVASLVYGAGMVVNAAERWAGSTAAPSAGNLVALAAMPLMLAVIVTLPRSTGAAARPARLLADAAVVASAAALVLWQTIFTSPGAVLGAGAVGALAAVALELLIIGYLVGFAVLGRERHVVLVLVGYVALAAGDIVTVRAVITGDGATAWIPLTVMCLGYPSMCAGTLLISSRPPAARDLESDGAETRASLVTVLMLTVAGAAALLASYGRLFDGVSRSLLALLLIAVLVREAVVQRQRMRDVQELRHLAEHDALTGAGNRRALTRVLSGAVSPSTDRLLVVLDLDGFKAINDRYGPCVGDALLCAVVEALGRVDPDGTQVFRLGADDFAVLVHGSSARAEVLAQRACTLVAEAACAVPGAERLALTAHAGVDRYDGAVQGADGDAWSPVTRATQALVAAQRGGGPRAVVWGAGLAAAQQRRSVLEERLRVALAERSLEIHLQPVVTLATNRLHGFEALSRWHDAVLGTVLPDEFVPVAEETGLVVDLGASVLDASLAALVRCEGVAMALTMAVNASPMELRRVGYVESVAAALAEHGVPPDLLVVEVTEAVMVAPDDPAVGALRALADLGVRIAVDDFGTGYSSLAYLTRLPVHLLKIDRSLTASLHDRAPAAVVQAAAAMAAGMGLEVVAEGVEDVSQLAALSAMGIGAGQGWLWSRAVPEQDAVELVRAGRALGPCGEEAPGSPGLASAARDPARP